VIIDKLENKLEILNSKYDKMCDGKNEIIKEKSYMYDKEKE
jgi:hypothetical protein